MAKLPKSQDPANWRKGKALQVGDLVSMVRLTEDGNIDYDAGRSLQVIATITMENRNYRIFSADGRYTTCVSGHEFTAGRF